MDQSKARKLPSVQVKYLGRWVDKDHFRTFVFNENEKKLAHSYEEFTKLIESGLWFDEKGKKAEEKIKKRENKPIKLNEFKAKKSIGK